MATQHRNGKSIIEDFEEQRANRVLQLQGKGAFLPRAFGAVLDEVLSEAESPAPVVPTGLSRLDWLLDGGIRPGEVFVLAARPRIGKSALAMQFVFHAAREGHMAYVWTREMSEEAYVRRALAAAAKVSNRNIRTGKLSDVEWVRLVNAAGTIAGLPLYFATGKPDIATVTAEMRSMALSADGPIPLAVIDYLQLLEPPQGMGSREQEVAAMSRAIKFAAKDLGIGVLLIAQLNRQAEDRAPRLSDLRESGSIEADADIVGLLHRRPQEDDSPILSPEAMLYLSKNRDGQEGTVALRFEGEHFHFHERVNL